jgi:protein ImuA
MDMQSRQKMAAFVPKKLGTRSRQIDDLRLQIGEVEGPGRSAGRGVLSFDVPAMDDALPEGGLPLSCVHEVRGAYGDGAAPGFCAALLARLSQMKGMQMKGAGLQGSLDAAPVLWLEAGQGLYLPGLAQYGLQPGQLFLVSNIRKSADRLWVLEEALRCGALAGVVAELDEADFTASRRLQLAAEAGNTTGLVLSEQGHNRSGMASAVTRWQVDTMPSLECRLNSGPPGVGDPCWDVALTHSRGGRPDRWSLQWHDQAWQCQTETAPVVLPVAANDDAHPVVQVTG